jgi:hypothetical protein
VPDVEVVVALRVPPPPRIPADEHPAGDPGRDDERDEQPGPPRQRQHQLEHHDGEDRPASGHREEQPTHPGQRRRDGAPLGARRREELVHDPEATRMRR